MKKIYNFLAFAFICGAAQATLPTPAYQNTFDTEAERTACTIMGDGSWTQVDGRGYVFQHGMGEDYRTNYLLLPSTTLTSYSSDAEGVTIGFWTKLRDDWAGVPASYYWGAMFAAYGAAPVDGVNTWPRVVALTRCITQINCSGWCDFGDDLNVSGANTLTTLWTDDAAWHYYTMVYTATNCKIYIDGSVINEWNVDGTTDGQVVSGLLSGASQLTYVCLGGNQAWNYSDADMPFLYDDFRVYGEELSAEQIAEIISAMTTSIAVVEAAESEVANVEYFNLAGQKIASPQRGINIAKIVYTDGSVATRRILK